MLAFIDESGDAGMALDRGSSPFFTIAVVVFGVPDDARGCQSAIEELRARLRMNPRAEFHFHSDSHERRLQFLSVLHASRFRVASFTLDKSSPRLKAPGCQFEDSLYKSVCGMAMENAADILEGARVVIDGSGDRTFRRQLGAYLRRSMQRGDGRLRVDRVAVKPSHSDPLLQVADYCAGVVNRYYSEKAGAGMYMQAVERKFVTRHLWPG